MKENLAVRRPSVVQYLRIKLHESLYAIISGYLAFQELNMLMHLIFAASIELVTS
jgi:hypothetical protein